MSQTVIIFQDDSILAAGGKEGQKPQIHYIKRQELSSFGDPFARWKNGLKELREEIGPGRVRLVLPASMCSVKSMKLPYVKGKELDAMVRREMQESFRGEIMDYAVIKSDAKQGVTLVGASVEKDVLKNFLDICREVGIIVGGVTVPMEGIQRVIRMHRESAMSTAIFLFFEEETLTSVLMEKGQYKYSGRNRLFAEFGTLDFGTEIARNVSGILQFHTASKSEEIITDVYYAGCPEEDFEASLEELSALNLDVQPFGEIMGVRMPDGEKTTDWISCVGAMMSNLKDKSSMNLLNSYESDDPDLGQQGNVAKHVLPVFVVFAVCVVIFAGVRIRYLLLQNKISEKQDQVIQMQESSVYKQAQESRQQADQIIEIIKEIGQLEDNLATYPKINESILSQIERANAGLTVKIRGYDADSGVLTFDAASKEVIDIPGYIKSLEETNLFHTVEYTGYTYEENVYTLSLLCTMESPKSGGNTQ